MTVEHRPTHGFRTLCRRGIATRLYAALLAMLLLVQSCAKPITSPTTTIRSTPANATPVVTPTTAPTRAAPSATSTVAPTRAPSATASATLQPVPSATAPQTTPTRQATATTSSSPTPAKAQPTPTLSYTIKEGDTLLAIALKYGVSVESLQRTNQIEDAARLKLEQVLVIPPPDPTPQASSTAAPSPTAPLPGHASLACAANTAARTVALGAEPIRLVIQGEQAFFVAGGDLYVASLADLAASGDLAPQSAMPPERKVGPYTIQELVYAAADPATGDLVLLDKSTDIYRRAASGEWRMAHPAGPVRGAMTDPQYLAVQPLGDSLYALDADNNRVWRFGPGAAKPAAFWQGAELAGGVDLAMRQGEDGSAEALVLDGRGRVFRFRGGQASVFTPASAGIKPWPAQVAVDAGHLWVVEGQQRRVSLFEGLQRETQLTVEFRLPGMRRLRGAAVAGDTLYALAGSTLYSVPLGGAAVECPAISYDDGYYYAGREMGDLISGVGFPFPQAALPSRPRSYPGARRLYRYGVHEGVDLYPGDVPGLAYGSPVRSIGAGAVIRADTAFVEMTPEEYAQVMARTEAEHRTPPELLDKLRGRQVYVAHGPGVEAHYCHLQDIAPGIDAGAQVAGGDVVGQVGASGTEDGVRRTGGGEHLHWEIWIDGRYLGHGLGLYETMRLWQALFTP